MRYFLGFLAVITLVVIVFVMVLHGFTGGSKPKNQITMIDYANSETTVELTVEGPVNADQLHQGYDIVIGRDANTMTVTSGYQDHVTQTKTYGNNSDAYADFLRALQLQNFTKGDPDAAKADDRGVCPNGSRYTFEIHNSDQTVQRYWTTSCGGGTFKGNSPVIRTLFQKQIPDFSKLTETLILGQ
jgi:hypothetical protein